MENLKTKLALLGILAVIGIGMVLAAYFIGISGNNEKSQDQIGDKDIAIILKPAQEISEKECEETDSCAITGEEIQGEGNETKPEEAKLDGLDSYGDAGVSENETILATGFAEAGCGRGIGSNGAENIKYAVEPETVQEAQEAVPTPALPSAPPSLESLKQNITANYMNIVVMNKGEVMSNETVNLDN
jgi:hypothetical protein